MTRPTPRRVGLTAGITIATIAALHATGQVLLTAWLCHAVKDMKREIPE